MLVRRGSLSQGGLGAGGGAQGKNCLGCRGCTLCQSTQITCRSWEMQVLSQQDWGATQDSVFLTSSQVMLMWPVCG